jgi:chemotaxis protein CheX
MANMIIGNTATIFSNKGMVIEITPPNLCIGSNLSFDVGGSNTVCVPFNRDDGTLLLEVNIALRNV